MTPNELSESIKAELARINGEVTERCDTPIRDMRARLQSLEQRVLDGDWHSELRTGAGGLNLSAVVDDDSFARVRAGKTPTTDRIDLGLEIKALVTHEGTSGNSPSGGIPSRADQIPGYHGYVIRPPRLVDLLPFAPQTSNSFDYVRLTFSGDAEVQEGEGAEKAEMEVDGELITGKVATIAVHTTASAQVLDDNVQLQNVIQNILSQKSLQTLENQLIVGSGTGENIEGLYTAATPITTYKNAIPDRIGEALTAMETAGYAPNVILMNPDDWFEISIMKDDEGRYLYGDPSNPAPPSLWNRPVVTSPVVPQGTAVIGDTLKAEVRDRMQPTVFISRDHKDYRTRNLVLILVELRAGLAIYDENAFRKVDLSTAT